MRKLECLAALLIFFAAPVAAQADPRIVELTYDPDIVYALSISQGHASVVQLERGEAVESIVLGQAEGWLVEPTASADRVIVKPLAGARRTNLTILTTKRSYSFTLDANGGLDIFVMRFSYATGASDVGTEPVATYRFRGDRDLFPRLMTDNGRTTSVFWSPEKPFPAVFVLDSSRDEVAANYRAAGDGLIIEGVHDEVVFRSGDDKARAHRRENRQ